MAELPATINGLRRMLAAGDLDPATALRIQRDRVAPLDARYRCVARVHDVAEAGEGTRAGPLTGVGLAHKDIFETGDGRMQCGRPEPLRPVLDPSPALVRLASAGAANLAALTMAEFACGATGANPWTARPVNPLFPDAVVGGSSSGSAVAVACGLAYASLGTDTAGSVRIPAATCGLVGLKPTRNVMSRSGAQALAPSLDTVGVLARSAADAALVFAAAASSPEDLDPVLRDADALPAALLGRKNWRVRHHFPAAQLDEAVNQALGTLAANDSLCVSNRAIDLPMLEELTRLAHVMLHVEAAITHRALLRADRDSNGGRDRLAASTRAVLLPGLGIPGEWYRQAQEQRAGLLAGFVQACFTDADLLLLPALSSSVPDWDALTPGTPLFDRHALGGLYRWMPFVNYLGLPSIVFPIGRDVAGRPVCVQAVARPYAEATLLAFAYRYERDHCGTDGFALLPSFPPSNFSA